MKNGDKKSKMIMSGWTVFEERTGTIYYVESFLTKL